MAGRHRIRPRSAATVSLVLLVALAVWGTAWLLNGSGAGTERPVGEASADEDADADEGRGAEDVLADGEHFGFVSAFTVDAITFEPAEYLTGEEAREAAREDGQIGPDDDLPNDFYVRQAGSAELTLPVEAGFEASLLDNGDLDETHTLDAESMAGLYAGELDAPWMYDARERLPVVLRIEGGQVVGADQHYLP